MRVRMRLEIAGYVVDGWSAGTREIGLLSRAIEADWDAMPQLGDFMPLGITTVPAQYDEQYDGLGRERLELDHAWHALVCHRSLHPDHGFLKLAPVRCRNAKVAEALCRALVADGWIRHI